MSVFKNKLILLFLVISIIPVLIIGIFSYNLSADIIRSREIDEKLQLLDVVAQEVTDIINEKHLVAVKLHYDEYIQKYLGREPELNKGEEKEFEFEVKRLLFYRKNAIGTKSIHLFSNAGMTYSYNKSQGLEQDYYRNKNWYQESVYQNQIYFWGEIEKINGENVIPYVRIISKIESPSTSLGMLVINLKESYINRTYRDYARDRPGFYFILNRRNNVISSYPRPEYLGNNILRKFDLQPERIEDEKGHFEKKINNKKYIFIYNSNQQTGGAR